MDSLVCNICRGTPFSRLTNLYVCHRSWQYIPEGSNRRHLQCQGSNKIGAFCPAAITVTTKDGSYYISYTKTHVGHDNDLGHLFLNNYEKQKLASKIAAKIPLSVILDEIRDSISNTNFDRVHLLTKKDLYNIEQTYNLNNTSVRHKSDAISVQAWINDLQNSNCILFYKPQDELSEEYSQLKSEDFVLILMTDGQKEMLSRFGNDCVCIDGTHGTNSYGFELITLLVLDEMREGFPCIFMISNRSDEEAMYIFFCCVEKSFESIERHIERMHNTIKYMYLNGKYNKRVDKAINAILKFVRDKLFDRLITIQKGKLCSKIKELRSRHKTSQQLDLNLVVPMETGWQVPSSSSQEIYLVEERKLECHCKLVCLECDACLYKYSCTCLDSSIRYNMCKHIHLVCRYEIQKLSVKHAGKCLREVCFFF